MTDTAAPASAAPQSAPVVNPFLIAMVVSLAAFMEVLDTTIVNVSLTHIAGNLAASQDESSWVLTSYLVANGIVLPLSGWLAGVLGRKNFFMLCIALFTAASLACGLAASLPMLIFFRLLQGLAGGGLQPMQQSIVMDSFPPEKRGTAFGITGVTMIVAPILGPTLGGLITDNTSWRWIFFMNVPVGIMAFFLVGRLVQDPPHAKAKGAKHIDVVGLSLVALALGTMQVVLDKGQEDDWFASNFIVVMTLISVAAFIAGIVWLMKQEDPIIDLSLLKERSFSLACLMVFAVGFALYGCSTLLPLLVQSQFGYDATLAGMVLSPGGIALIFLMPIVGKLVNKIEAKYLIAFGMFAVSVGMWMTSYVTPQTDYHTFVMLRILQVIGLPFLFIPSSTMAFSNVPLEKSSKASALYSLMRNLGGSFGISILLNYVTQHEQSHQAYLSAHLSPADAVYSTALAHTTHVITDMGNTPAAAHGFALGHLYQGLLHQSAMLAYTDAFR
ncbi:MAG TPA: DHA2 family efflux MFS transporter permease subunit, partial [Alphaproteobacteria bacterium]|nr:DHA2 family efflux MFS transporter permease subunit [Alphaproteobacteria bacterium]